MGVVTPDVAKDTEPHDADGYILRWQRICTLFPSLKTISVYTFHPFSLTDCVVKLRRLFECFHSLKTIELKEFHPRNPNIGSKGKGTWIHQAFVKNKEQVDNELNQCEVIARLSKSNDLSEQGSF